MLESIRHTADKLLIRLLLGFLAFTFVAWGIKDVIQSSNDFELVTFSKIPSITKSEFLKAKSEEITTIQRQNKISLTEEQIQSLGVDNTVLQTLINNRILNSLIKDYQLNLSDDLVIKLIKESQIFKNDKGEFDINSLRAMLKNNYLSEEEYVESSKKKILANTFISIFLESFKTPDVMVKNIINYMSERREFDLIQIDLASSAKNTNLQLPTKDQQEEFYNKNNGLFVIPEKRTFSYISIVPSSLQNKIAMTEEELLNFYNENKEEFANQNFDKAKKSIKLKLSDQKLNDLIINLAQNLEDDVAAGLRLKEIAEKHALIIEKIQNKTHMDISNDPLLVSIVDSIFELTEEEVSYPTELNGKKGIVLAEMNAITQSSVPKLEEIIDQVTSLWQSEYLATVNLERLQNLSRDYKPETLSSTELANLGIKVSTNTYLIRSKLQDNKTLPPELLLAIFQTKTGENTHVFKFGNTAYFGYLKTIKFDNNAASDIQKNSTDKISALIKNSILDELFSYGLNKNNMKIHHTEKPLE